MINQQASHLSCCFSLCPSALHNTSGWQGGCLHLFWPVTPSEKKINTGLRSDFVPGMSTAHLYKIYKDDRIDNFLQMEYGLSAFITECAVFIASYLPEAISVMLTPLREMFIKSNLSEFSPQTTNHFMLFMTHIKAAIKTHRHL